LSRSLTRYKSLAKVIGSRSDYVARLLTTLKVYKVIEDSDFFDIEGLGEESLGFSLILTALGYKTIVRFIGIESNQDIEVNNLNRDHLKELTSWIFDKTQGRTRIGESRNLAQLEKIVDSDSALKAFRDGQSLKDAYLLTEGPAEVFRQSIDEAYRYLQTAWDHMRLVDEFSNADTERLQEIAALRRNIALFINAKQQDLDADL